MIDAHLHLDQYQQEELERLIDEWRGAGIEAVVAVSTDLASSYQTLEIKQQFPDFVYAAVGHHPEQPLANEADTNELLALIECEREQIAAIGEVGLPYYAMDELGIKSLDPYMARLETFMVTAKKHHLPLALHAVHDQVAPVLGKLGEHKVEHAHFHWLKAVPEDLQRVFDSGYALSLTPEVCYRARDQKLAGAVPMEQLMLETDGPWAFAGPFEGKQTTPLFLREAVKKIAETKNRAEVDIVEQTLKNTRKIYGSL